jgi:gluconate kinase
LTNREGHFFDPALLRSPFDDPEEPCDAIEVDLAAPPETVAESIIAVLGLHQAAIS